MNEYLLLLAIYGTASLLQGVVGFGFALFSVPLVATIYDPGVAVAMNAVAGTANCGYKAWLLRKEIDTPAVLRFFAVTTVLVPVGVLAITLLTKEVALIAMGIFILAVAVGNFRNREGMRSVMRSRVSFWTLGSVAGVLAGAFSSPGAAAVPYFVSRDREALRGKANLQLYFTLVAIPVVTFHGIAGNMTLVALGRASIYLPIVFLVTYLGTRLSQRAPEKGLRRLVDGALILLALWLLLDNTLL